MVMTLFFFFFSSRRRHTRLQGDWSSDVCSSDLSKTQTPRAGRADHQPGPTAREMVVGNLAGEFLVIGLVVVPTDALFRHAGGATGFKNVERPAFEFCRHPDFRLQVAQRFILEMLE